MIPRVAHTHTSSRGRREKLRLRLKTTVRVSTQQAQQGQKDEDMKRGQDRTKVYVVAMKRNQVHSAQGQTMNPTSLSNLGETWV